MLRLDNDDRLVFEPRMTGLVLTVPPPGPEHTRLILHLTGRRRLTFWDRRGLGTIRLLDPTEYDVRVCRKIGPDALTIGIEAFAEAIGRGRRAVKVALLDQRIVAGVGNLYASELCFIAGVDPRTRCDRLSLPQRRRLHAAMVAILTDAIAAGGSTLADGTYRTAENRAGGFQHRHLVYDRAGQACRRCGGRSDLNEPLVRRIVQSGRSTFLCPGCQRRRGGTAYQRPPPDAPGQ